MAHRRSNGGIHTAKSPGAADIAPGMTSVIEARCADGVATSPSRFGGVGIGSGW